MQSFLYCLPLHADKEKIFYISKFRFGMLSKLLSSVMHNLLKII